MRNRKTREKIIPKQLNLLLISDKSTGLRHGSAADSLLGLRVQIPPEAWLSVSCECCVLHIQRFLGSADRSSREVLPSMVCLSVIVKPR
jgi:hypothetical protein